MYLHPDGKAESETRVEFIPAPISMHESQSAAWRSGSVSCFYDGHDRKVDGSTPTQASLLRPWIRCLIDLIPLSLSSYHEKAAEALCLGRIQTRLGVAFISEFSG